MKAAFTLFLTILTLAAFAQCHVAKGYDPLRKFMADRQLKTSLNNANEESGKDYSPVYIGCQEGLKEADKIRNLPGQPDGVNFDQYSGYVTVDPKAGRALFYYFAESQNSSGKPLVLWLGGGTGCSSFGYGAMTELGPFRVNKDKKTLWLNKYAWNNVANVLFLESPAGVGFSYSNTSSGHNFGDNKTTVDSYTLLVNWLEIFPEYETRDFFITGDDYAGFLVPRLAQLILHNNKITNQTIIKLKGIAIGNAYVDYETSMKGFFDYLWSHSLISDEIRDAIFSNCNFSAEARESDTCVGYLDQGNRALGNIYDYDIYAPWCSSSASNIPSISEFDPCTSSYALSYLNIPEVQKSLHANVTGIPGPWSFCNDFISQHWKYTATMLPVIKGLMESGISVWMYSGDTDNSMSVTATKYAINKLGISVKTAWHAWYTQGEVGGYVVEYHNLTFVTVRGSGHFVPSYQPARALALFSSFIEGKLPPLSYN